MSNDTIVSILFVAIIAIAFMTGALMGSLRRDSEWRIFLADQRSADKELEDHWNTAVRDPESKSLWND